MGYMGYYHEARQVILNKMLTSGKIEIGCLEDATEIHRDIALGEIRQIAVCGNLYNRNYEPICGEVIKIVKRHYQLGKELLEVVAYTKTNARGEYNVIVCGTEDESFYVLVEGCNRIYEDDRKCYKNTLPMYPPTYMDYRQCNVGYENTNRGCYWDHIGYQASHVSCPNSSINYYPTNRQCYLSGRAISGYVNF